MQHLARLSVRLPKVPHQHGVSMGFFFITFASSLITTQNFSNYPQGNLLNDKKGDINTKC